MMVMVEHTVQLKHPLQGETMLPSESQEMDTVRGSLGFKGHSYVKMGNSFYKSF